MLQCKSSRSLSLSILSFALLALNAGSCAPVPSCKALMTWTAKWTLQETIRLSWCWSFKADAVSTASLCSFAWKVLRFTCSPKPNTVKRDRAKSDHAGYLCKDALCPSLQGLHGFSHCCHNLRLSDSDVFRHTVQANHSAKHQTLPDYHIDPTSSSLTSLVSSLMP